MRYRFLKISLALCLLFFSTNLVYAGGFLKVSGKSIVDGQGNEIVLRGMGLGGWLLPEGYMLHTSEFANAFWQMKAAISTLVGPENADTFWTAYRTNFVQRKDIEKLAEQGFNSVRPALHWEHFMNSDGSWQDYGFIVMDSLLRQCADNNIYVILDLHAAPGGQNKSGISDYNPAYPTLWQSDTNKQYAVQLWKKLAERYKDEQWIGGYDLLNETVWNFPDTNRTLREFYVMVTDSIRSVDTNHIIFIEGNNWANDFRGLPPAWDTNMVWSFHKYWNKNDVASINSYLQLRDTTNRPLWLGESGENSNTWFTDAISLLESNNIGWSWWTLKKFETVVGPYNVPISPEYALLLEYWKGKAAKPTVEFAMNALMGMAEGLKLENCEFRPDVIDAMLRQPHDNTLLPYSLANNAVPGKIFFSNYDMGKYGIAYSDVNYQNTGSGSWNTGGKYRNDGVDIEVCTDTITNGYDVGWTKPGEFLVYTLDVKQSGTYAVSVRVAATATGALSLSWDGGTQTAGTFESTGSLQTWQTVKLMDVDLSAGIHTLKANIYFGGFNLNYLDFVYLGSTSVGDEKNIPLEYSLSQNFPNPFNPTTMISYSVGASDKTVQNTGHGFSSAPTFVSLKIYDVLGKEVATLVNEHKPAGNYSVNFDATNLSSGIYFYTLTAGNFVQTKKMMFIQ